MDLSDIESWTRELVVSEARRRGIREPELRPTSVLVRLILRDQYGARVNARRKRFGARLEQARALVESVVDALPEALVALRGRAPSADTPPPEPPPPPRPAARAPTRARRKTPSVQKSEVVPPQPEVASASSVEASEEPVRPSSTPSKAARPKAKAARPQPWQPNPDEDAVVCFGEPEGARVCWATSAEGRERASLVLGEPGRLALRVISIAPDPERTVATRIEDELLEAEAGERVLQAVPEGARRLVAVGLKGANRFVSIAHAKA